jgi:hypothetical protein
MMLGYTDPQQTLEAFDADGYSIPAISGYYVDRD